MNSLSWMIYLAEVSQNLRILATIGLTMGGVLGGIGLMAILDMGLGGRPNKKWWFGVSLYILLGILGASILAFMPSSRTIYMIAASEAGETVVSSPEAKEMLNDLRELIRRKLKDEVGA